MTAIGTHLRQWAALLVLAFGAPAAAQDAAWVRVEALPTLAEAEARARAYEDRFDNVEGYRIGSGWYAIALGPFAPAAARQELARLRAARAIPGDSFISDGGNFGDQFWPVGVQGGALNPIIAPTEAPAPPAAPADETPEEARATERLLDRTGREEIQRAMQATGFYRSRIDGSFGPGTRRAMADWQAARGYEATGVLTTRQREELVGGYREAIDSLGLQAVYDARAGIEITLPLGAVAFTAYDAPFARYEGEDAQVLLISQSGDEDTLRGLFDVLQTLEIVPLDGDRSVGRSRFTIDGANDRIATRIEAQLTRDGVKGFALVWPAEDPFRRSLALEAMQASFAPVEGVVLPDGEGRTDLQRPDLLSGLQIRQPEISASGFFVDRNGAVLTTAEAVASCARITLDGETEATVTASDGDLGVALLAPGQPLAPMGVGRFRASVPRLQSEIAVAGYSYGGVLGAPTISFGTLEDIRGLNGEAPLARLALSARAGDAGGPILDASGGVLGLLLPQPGETDRSLPEDVRFAANAASLAAFLGEHGIDPSEPAPTAPLQPADIALVGADMTVLVECWN